MKNTITDLNVGSHRPIRRVFFTLNGMKETATLFLLRNGGIHISDDNLSEDVINQLTRLVAKQPGMIEFDSYQEQYQTTHHK